MTDVTSNAPDDGDADRPAAGAHVAELDATLLRLIDVDGRAVAVAVQAEQLIRSGKLPIATRDRLVASMNDIINTSENANLLLEDVQRVIRNGAAQPMAADTAMSAPVKRNRPRTPRVRL